MLQTLTIILTVLCYGAAGYLLFQQRSYRYLAVLIPGHLTALFLPLWQKLFAFTYDPKSYSPIARLFGRDIPSYIFFGSAWFYALPALVLYFIYRRGWWPRHYTTGLVAFMGMLLYHLLLQGLARQSGLWVFDTHSLPLNFPLPLLVATLAALVSLLLLYVLISTRHYPWNTLLGLLVGAVLGAPLLVYGILGAPFWLPQRLDQPPSVVGIGLVVTLGVVLWAVHLTCWGLHATRQQHVRWS